MKLLWVQHHVKCWTQRSLIALVHLCFGSVRFQQDILSILFGFIGSQFCFRDLNMKSKAVFALSKPDQNADKANHLEL